MAVSHQWLMEWSPPSVVFADINREYHNVDSNWKSDTIIAREIAGDTGYQKQNLHPRWKHREVAKYPGTSLANTDRPRLTGVTLWLTMMGVTNAWSTFADTPPFTTLHKWRRIDFEFSTQDDRQQALDSGTYIPENVLPLGLEVWGDRIWVTLPSWKKGVPATLATILRPEGDISPHLHPYPDWSFHRGLSDDDNCTGLTSVFRINVDQCGRLWVLDSGQIESQDEPKQICPPSIAMFDLQTDTIQARYVIPKEYVLQNSLFSNIIVDSLGDDCLDLHVYITDTWRFGLIVFRKQDASFWRFNHHFFFPDPLSSNYSLHGLNFQWTDGIFGLALSPVHYFKDRLLYFHSMSGSREFFVKTSILKDPSAVNISGNEFKMLGQSRGLNGHSSASAIDNNGVMFYGMVTRDTVGCWDTNKVYARRNLGVVAMNTETLVFPNDIKIDHEKKQNVWVLSNRLPMFQVGPLDPDDFHFRILVANAEEAVRSTVCDPNMQPLYPAAAKISALY